MMKYLFFLLSASIVLLQSCGGNDDLTELEQATLNATCYQDEGRKVVAVFEDIEAVVVHPSINNCSFFPNNSAYLIEGSSAETTPSNFGSLASCNLSEEFKTDADRLHILVSGYAFETFELEDSCAVRFEITDIQLRPNQ